MNFPHAARPRLCGQTESVQGATCGRGRGARGFFYPGRKAALTRNNISLEGL